MSAPTPPPAQPPSVAARPAYDPPPPGLGGPRPGSAPPAYAPPPPYGPPPSGPPRYGSGPGGSSPAPGRRGWPWWAVLLLVLGILVVVAVVAVAVLVGLAISTSQTEDGTIEPRGEVARLEVVAEVGSVTLDGSGDRDTVEGTWEVRTSLGSGSVDTDLRGDTLVVTLDCPEPAFGQCRVDLDLDVPADLPVDVRVNAGEIVARGLAGDVDAVADVGSINLSGLESSAVRAEANVGDVRLTFAEPPQEVVASADVGNVDVAVPDDGTEYAVTSTHDVGEDAVTIPTDPSADRTISVSVDVGEARVRPAS